MACGCFGGGGDKADKGDKYKKPESGKKPNKGKTADVKARSASDEPGDERQQLAESDPESEGEDVDALPGPADAPRDSDSDPEDDVGDRRKAKERAVERRRSVKERAAAKKRDKERAGGPAPSPRRAFDSDDSIARQLSPSPRMSQGDAHAPRAKEKREGPEGVLRRRDGGDEPSSARRAGGGGVKPREKPKRSGDGGGGNKLRDEVIQRGRRSRPSTRDASSVPNVQKSDEDAATIARSIRSCPFFLQEMQNAPPDVPERLARAMEEVTVNANVDLITQGALNDDSFFVLVEGKVNVLQRADLRLEAGADMTKFLESVPRRNSKPDESAPRISKGGKSHKGMNVADGVFDLKPSQDKLIKVLEPGAYFGEVSLLFNTARTATIRSQAPGCRAFKLRRSHYESIVLAAKSEIFKRRFDLVSKVGLFRSMDKTSCRTIVGMSDSETVAAGEVIFQKGDFGDKLFLVEAGVVSIQVEGHEVRRFGPGDCFGEVALMNFGTARTADAIVPADVPDGKCELLSVSRENFENILGPLKLAINGPRLSTVPLFAPLSQEHIEELAQALQLRKFSDGASVVRQGEAVNALFFVDQGSFLETWPTDNRMRTIREGDWFGLEALAHERPSPCEVRSVGLSAVMSLAKSAIDKIEKDVGVSLPTLQSSWRRENLDGWTRRPSVKVATAAEIDVLVAELELKFARPGDVLADSREHPNGKFVGLVMSGNVLVVSTLERGGDEKPMERKRLITEGPLHLASRAQAAAEAFRDSDDPGRRGKNAIGIKLVAMGASVLLVPPPSPSPALTRALECLKETPPRARQSVNLSASSSGRSAGSDEPLPGSPSAFGGDRPPPRGGVQRRKSVSDLGTGLSVVRETIALQKLVGKGGFSRVFHVKATARKADGAPIPGRDFVLKLIPIRKLVKSGVEHTVRHERDLLSSVRHASVVRLHTAFKAMDHIYLIMDLVTGRDFYWIMQHYNLSDAGARFYIAQIVMVLEYLHKLSIAYRDVKPENFIVTTKDGYLRMIDFGLSKLLGPGERSYTFCGTPLYLAPEVWGSNGHNRSVDLWALGVLTYEMAFGKLPFEAKSESELKQKVVGDALKFPREIGSFGNDEIDPRLKSLIMGLLEKNSTRRLGMSKEGTKAVRSSAWFKDLDWHAIEKRKLEPPFYPRPENEREAAAKLTAADSELVPPTSADCPRYGDRFPDF